MKVDAGADFAPLLIRATKRRLDDAREIVGCLQAFTSVVLPSHVLWRKPEHRELLLSGLRLAAGGAT